MAFQHHNSDRECVDAHNGFYWPVYSWFVLDSF